jgi:D-glycero-D-manno-heptose 1,7-bisphosphate phosphatase
MNKAVFLGKDGTLIRNVPNNIDPANITLDPYAIHALQVLHQQDYMIFMITNQPGIAHGNFSEADIHAAYVHIIKQLRAHGVKLHGFYYCPHHPQGKQWPYNTTCTCRKPQPGMLLRAAEEYNVNLTTSWMIGDTLDDVEAGNRAGCKTVLIDNGNETGWNLDGQRKPGFVSHNLLEAADFIARRTSYGRLVEQL